MSDKEEAKIEEAKIEGLISLPMRIRGNHSNKFRSIKVISNHYYLQVKKAQKLTIFSVRFTPFIPDQNSKLRNELLAKITKKLGSQIKNPVFSGKNIYTLTETELKQKVFEQQQYTISIKKVKILEINQNSKLFLTFMNSSLRNEMSKLNYVEIGRTSKYFNSKDKKNIDNLIMYNGFKSNFVQLQKGLYLRVDSAKKIVRNQTVLEYIDHTYSIHKDKNKQEKRLILKQNLIGQTVMANYGKTVYHRIGDIQFIDMATVIIPELKCTLAEYYKNKYNITIKQIRQPLIKPAILKRFQNRPQRLEYLVPELLLMTGIPEHFDQFRRKKISQLTIKPAHEKHKEINELMNKLKDSEIFNRLEQIGIKLNRKMQKISAKAIINPILELGKKKNVDIGKEAFFSLFNYPIFSAKHKVEMGIISFKGADLGQLLNVFQNTSRKLQVQLTFQVYQISGKISSSSIQKQIDICLQKKHNICLIIIPNNMASDYNKLKIRSIQANQMLTQFMQEKIFKKNGFQSIATKVLLQIIAKRGNTLWCPKTLCKIENTMLVAFDTCKLYSQTLMAVCATINSTFSSVYSAKCTYKENNQKFNKMSDLLLSCCNAYLKRNKVCPKQIVLFMNACPEDQVRLYHELFIQPTMTRYAQSFQNRTIKLLVAMVNVKTSERFFVEDGDQIRNVIAGTVVSSDLVSNKYDFYITSQQPGKGTSVPNHYRVIYSNCDMQEGELQQLAFSQCFNYVNWTGSIKVPAILQYAKKCAKFNAEVLQNKQIPESLQTKLYFV